MIIGPGFMLWIVLMTPAILFAVWAQIKVKTAFSKYARVGPASGMTGAEAAAAMLEARGLRIVGSAAEAGRTEGAVAVEQVKGFLGDHYDPRARVLRLSPQVYGGRSLSAVGVACHEAGHALQHAEGYAALSLRNLMVPVASFGSWAAFPLIFIGLIVGMTGLAMLGVALFTAIVMFQLVTLPVEFDASKRAKAALTEYGIISGAGERKGVASVLNAAALTYVAALVGSIMTLLYYLMLLSGMSRD